MKKTYRKNIENKKGIGVVHKTSKLSKNFTSIFKLSVALALFFIAALMISGAGIIVEDGALNVSNDLFLSSSQSRFYRNGNALRIDSIFGLFELGSSTSGNDAFLKMFSSAGFAGFYDVSNLRVRFASDNNLPIVFEPNQVETMRLTPAGNVGIGTTNPQSTLQVNGYVQLALTSGAPSATDCDAAAEEGRMKFDPTADLLYICSGVSGWISK